MWSQANEANPHAFELENGGLMVTFTLSETVDTTLPTAPETRYEIEGETISLWALTFVSLTTDESLGFLGVSQGPATATALHIGKKR